MEQGSLVGTHPDLEPLLGGAGPTVEDAQRARILDAISRVVAEKGYAAATVADVVRAARVSRGTFYGLFAAKEQCFLEAYAHGTDVLLARVREGARAGADSTDWRGALRGGMTAYLGTLAHEPQFARTYLLEIHAAGPAAQIARDGVLRRFATEYQRAFRLARKLDPSLRALTADELFVVSAGLDQLICARVHAEGVERLPGHTESFVRTAAALLTGAASTDPASRRA
ncbi:TetR/AcrR family transcriptional regulator [Paraconexibacter algicola]|uniref:TetR/AcrR family transcriptional regulator n=1 Tax=Paraconexibacter algicola TaxID=2133960 RepID=UPI00130483EC|nr:TetR/AcrR family transcriptional regulator [Paraconexibacter algicola]